MSWSLVPAGPAGAATALNVTTTADAPVDGTCADATPGTLSLREALCQAQEIGAADVVVPAGTYALTAGPLVYAPSSSGRTLRLIGAGVGATVVDGGGTTRILDLDRYGSGLVDVTVSGLTLRNGRPAVGDWPWGGGAIIAGSALPGQPDRLTLADCRVTGNANVPAGQSDGGAVGAGVQMNGGTLSVQGCTFDANTATDAAGGAIALVGVAASDQLTIDSSTFTGNASTGTAAAGVVGGGAVYVYGGAPTTTVTSSTFDSNTATTASTTAARGSAVLVESGTAHVSASRVTSNRVVAGASSTSSQGALALAAGSVTTSRLDGNTTTIGSAVTPDAVRGPVQAGGNWWGCANPAAGTGCDTAPGALTTAPYARVALSATPSTALAGTTVSVDGVLQMSDGSAVPAALQPLLTTVPLVWSATAGTVSGPTTLGTGTVHGTLTLAPDAATVSLGADGGPVTAAVLGTVPPVVTVNPVSTVGVEGGPAGFSVTATGIPAPTVQWQSSTDGTAWADVAGATGATLTLPTVSRSQDGWQYRAVASNGWGLPAISTAATLAVRWGPEVTATPAATTVVEGQSATFTVAGVGSPAPTVGWEISHDAGGSWSPVGATGATLVLPATATDDRALVRAVLTGQGVTRSAPATLTVQTRPTLSVVADATVADGGTTQLTVVAGGSPAPTVQWQQLVGATWTDVVGATGPTLTRTGTPALDGTQYRAVASSTLVDGPASATSNAATLHVLYGPVVDTSPTSVTAMTGAAVSFTAAAHGNPTPTVGWQTSSDGGTTWDPVPGATAGTYTRTLTVADAGLLVRAVFTGHGTTATTSATVTVHSAPAFSADPASATVAAGATASFAVTVTGAPTPTIQWQRLDAGTWTDLPGETGTTLDVAASSLLDGSRYRAVASATTVAGPRSATSAEATLTVLYGPFVDASPASVTGQPGGTVTFTAAAHGNPVPTVQWETSPDGTTWTPVAGATADTYARTVTLADDGLRVRAVYTGHGSTTTTAAVLTVHDGPAVTSQPADVTVDAGTTASFSVASSGLPVPSVQWQTLAGGTWTDVAGATGSTLSVTATAALDGAQYRAVLTNVVGTTSSDPATLTVLSAPTVSDPQSVATRPGDPVTFTVTTTGRPTPAVLWETSADGSTWTAAGSGPSLTLTPTAADDGLRVRARATAPLMGGAAWVTSAAATLTVVPPPVEISGSPASVAATVGTPVTVSFVVEGSALTARWEWSHDRGATWVPVPSSVTTTVVTGVAAVQALRGAAPATRAAYSATFTPTAADAGVQLRLVVTDVVGATVYGPVTAQVAAAPVPTASPSAAARASDPARLSSTGADVWPVLGLAGGLVLLGAAGVLVVAVRRRSA